MEQESYVVVDLMVSYDFVCYWNVMFNVNNVIDEKYIESLKKFGILVQGYYGDLVNVSLMVFWVF